MDRIGIAVRRSNMERPISSAKARNVDVRGKALAIWSRSKSTHKTKRVGDMGHPCLTPDLRVMEG